MGETYEDILKNIEPERVEIINRCIQKIQGKKEIEMIGLITEAAKEFNSAGRSMSADEKRALIYAMRENLPSDQKKKFDAILNMIGIK